MFHVHFSCNFARPPVLTCLPPASSPSPQHDKSHESATSSMLQLQMHQMQKYQESKQHYLTDSKHYLSPLPSTTMESSKAAAAAGLNFPPPMQYMGSMMPHLSSWQLAAH